MTDRGEDRSHRRTARRGRIAAAPALLALLVGASGCFRYSKTIEENRQRFERQHPDLLVSYRVGARTMRYARSASDPGRPLLLLLHGSPGSWDAWAEFLLSPELTRAYQVVAVDRPGFGGSDPGRAVQSLAEQARLIRPVLELRPPGTRAVVVGHSLGAPVAVQLALDHPDQVGGLLLVAGSVSPKLERRKWFQHLATWGLVRAFLPGPLDVCNQEIFDLKEQLELQDRRWGELRIPVHVIQGGEDDLVPPGNADYVESKVPPERLTMVRVPGMDHFVPWERQDLILDALLRSDLARSSGAAPAP